MLRQRGCGPLANFIVSTIRDEWYIYGMKVSVNSSSPLSQPAGGSSQYRFSCVNILRDRSLHLTSDSARSLCTRHCTRTPWCPLFAPSLAVTRSYLIYVQLVTMGTGPLTNLWYLWGESVGPDDVPPRAPDGDPPTVMVGWSGISGATGSHRQSAERIRTNRHN